MPTLETEIWQEYKDQGLVAFAISASTIGVEDPVGLADYVEAMGMTMTVLVDYSAELYEDYRITVPESFAPYPREFIVDRDGVVVFTSATIEVDAMKAVLDVELAAP